MIYLFLSLPEVSDGHGSERVNSVNSGVDVSVSQMHHHAKFRQNRSNCCGNIGEFLVFQEGSRPPSWINGAHFGNLLRVLEDFYHLSTQNCMTNRSLNQFTGVTCARD